MSSLRFSEGEYPEHIQFAGWCDRHQMEYRTAEGCPDCREEARFDLEVAKLAKLEILNRIGRLTRQERRERKWKRMRAGLLALTVSLLMWGASALAAIGAVVWIASRFFQGR